MTRKRSGIYLLLFSMLCLAAHLSYAASHGLPVGQNLIANSGFENDEVGQPPQEWALEKGG